MVAGYFLQKAVVNTWKMFKEEIDVASILKMLRYLSWYESIDFRNSDKNSFLQGISHMTNHSFPKWSASNWHGSY